MVLYEIYREDGGNGITFVHMLYNKSVQMYLLHLRLIKQKIVWGGWKALHIILISGRWVCYELFVDNRN